jgi:uncharacterized membrane protein YfcA
VDFDVVKRWSGFVLAGSLAGAWIAAQVHSRVLSIIFAVIALLVAARMVFVPEVKSVTTELPKKPWLPIVPTLIGVLSALMGIGGGVMSVTALTLFGMRIHRAVGTAALLGLAISIPGALGFIAAGWNDPRVPSGSLGYVSLVGFACIASTTILTAPLGARIAHAVSERRLSLLFGLFLALVATRLFLRALG